GLAEVPIPAKAAGPDEGGDVRQLVLGGDLDDLGHQRALLTIGSITGSRRSPKLVRARSMTSLPTDLSVFTAPRVGLSRPARGIAAPRGPSWETSIARKLRTACCATRRRAGPATSIAKMDRKAGMKSR